MTMAAIETTITDATLPQMAPILDATVMASHFNRARFGAPGAPGAAVQSCKIEWIKYKPAKNCTVAYRLTMADGAEQLLYGRIYADGGAAERFAETQTAPATRSQQGEPMVYLAALGMLCWRFPNDRKLDGLALLADENWLMTQALPKVVASLCGIHWRITAMSHHLVHYVPEHTCTVRVDLAVRHDNSGASQDIRLYGKTYYNDAGAQTYLRMQDLWQQAASGAAALTIAQPCAYDAAHKTLWQRSVAGQTLLQLEFASQSFMDALPLAAAAVAALHGSRVHCAKKVAVSDWLAQLQEVRVFLSKAAPQRAARLAPLVEGLVRQASHLGRQTEVTLHGDLHLGNILVDAAGKAALIDLDGLCQGSPLVDVGSFIAALIYQGLIQKAGEQQIHAMVEIFCRAYRSHAAWPVQDAELRWHVAVALVIERVYRCLTRMKVGRIEIVDDLIQQACRIAAMESAWVSS